MNRQIEKKNFYVTMNDSFMSGWGHADGKTNKLIIGCDTMEEALTVEQNALNRSEMKYVNICTTRPKVKSHHFVSYHDKSDYESWFIDGFFKG